MIRSAGQLASRPGALIAASAIAWTAAAGAEGPQEYEVKAAFLFNFSKFVEWPEGAFSEADRIRFCVLGEDPFGPLLEEVVKEKRVNGREVAVQRVAAVPAAAGCQVVFISSSEEPRLEEILAGLADRPVLTVSEGEAAAAKGAIIGLVLEENRVRFEVNVGAARRAKLRLGSQLLRVAVRLVGQSEPGH